MRFGVVLRRTFVGCDWHFDNLCGSHLPGLLHAYEHLIRPVKEWAPVPTCVWFALVCAEKLTNAGRYRSLGSPFISLSLTYTDLPVPVGPTSSTGLLLLIIRSIRYVYRAVSMVGTMISLIFLPLPPRDESLINLVQCIHEPRFLRCENQHMQTSVNYHQNDVDL